MIKRLAPLLLTMVLPVAALAQGLGMQPVGGPVEVLSAACWAACRA